MITATAAAASDSVSETRKTNKKTKKHQIYHYYYGQDIFCWCVFNAKIMKDFSSFETMKYKKNQYMFQAFIFFSPLQKQKLLMMMKLMFCLVSGKKNSHQFSLFLF